MKNKFLVSISSLLLFISICKGETLAMNNSLHNVPYEKMNTLSQTLTNELSKTPQKGFDSFQYYYANGDIELKSYMMATLKRTTLESNDLVLRQQTTSFLLNVVLHEEENQLYNEALNGLLSFSKNDFTAEAKNILEKIDISPSTELIKIMEAANIQSREKELNTIIATSESSQDRWAATMALARMGYEKRLKEVIQQVRSEADIVERSRLFDDLAWTKQQDAFDVLRGYLYSPKYLPDTRDHSKLGSPEATYAARTFIQYIKNCPVKSEFPNASELAIIANWADQQRIWVFN